MPYARHNLYSRRRRRRPTRRTFVLLSVLLVCGLLLFVLTNTLRRAKPDVLQANASPTQSAEGVVPSMQPAPEATPETTPEPALLPIVKGVETERRMIAITIDDCFQTKNIHKILRLADENGAKLTFFPIGHILKNSPDTWREIYDRGFELENHTYSHGDLSDMDEETIHKEIVAQNQRMNQILGVNYHMRFLRTMGGNARKDPSVHKVMGELGYTAMAHWSISGSDTTAQRVLKNLKPGQILLFHTTNSDLKKLQYFIPRAASMGYELVTLSELMGYGPNEVSELT